MWAQIVMAVLGVWMMVAPDLLGFSKKISDNAHVVGPLIVSFSTIAIWECTRNVRLLNLPLAVWLLAAPVILQYDNDTALMNDYAVAIAILFLLLVKPTRKHRFGGGWPSIWKSNSPHEREAGMRSAKNIFIWSVCVMLTLLASSCYRMRTSRGGGQTNAVSERVIQPSDILLMPEYTIDVVASGLTFPTGIDFDDQGQLYVTESGYVYGEVWEDPHLLRINADGSKTTIATGTRNGPWNGVDYHAGNFYVSEGGQANGGKILRIAPNGEITALVENLPSVGDHHTNQLVVHDGYIYFGQGSATNSGVVGEDNAEFGWLTRHKAFHDIPCKDVIISGRNYESLNVLTQDPDDKTSTGAFSPFGTTTSAGQVIRGSLPCNGAILRVPVTGGKTELVAWGLRNPFGLAIAQDGKLYTTENAYDDRGSRPVWGAGDVLWEVQQDKWYGWPDFSEGKLIVGREEFKAPSHDAVAAVIQKHPGTPPHPVAVFGVHSSANGFDFSRKDSFGFKGQAFVALFGDMAPNVGKVLAPVGFKVVRVDIESGVIRDFAVNKGKKNGPATWLKDGGLERPVSVRFSPDGNALYIVDFGILRMTDNGPSPQRGTGVLWRITKK